MQKEINKTNILELQRKGNYDYMTQNYAKMDKKDQNNILLNHIHPYLQIKMTAKKGRGVFATEEIKKG